MTTAVKPQSEFALEADDWLASILERSVARLCLAPQSLPNPNRLTESIQSREWQVEDVWRDTDCFVNAKIDCTRVDQVAVLEACGFRVVDVNVTSECDIQECIAPPTGASDTIEVCLASAAGREQQTQVLTIAETAFRFSRFHLDPQLDNQLADGIKREWVRNSLEGLRGDRVWIARQRGKVLGFLSSVLVAGDTSGSADSVAVIDLIAVATDAQGQGVGKVLTQHLQLIIAIVCGV